MSFDWERVRAEFPALSNWTYLNTATYGQTPRSAAAAVARHFARRDELACSDFLEWFDDADCVREHIGRLVNCAGEDIAFVSSASQALAVVLNGIDWKSGDQIVALEGEFPNNLYAPAMVRGAEFVQTSWERFYDSVGERTRLVIMSSANYSTGFRPPLEEVSRFLRGKGVWFYVDGTQSVGALKFDVQKVRPSVLAVHGYKWLLCPTASAFFYVDPEFRAFLPPNVVGWRSDKGWRNVNALNQGAPDLMTSAEKYEGGMIPFVLLYAMDASVKLMLDIGPELIEDRVSYLARRITGVVTALGSEVAHPGSHIVAARFPDIDAGRIASELKARRILVSARHAHLRISAQFYNNEADIEYFERILRSLLRR